MKYFPMMFSGTWALVGIIFFVVGIFVRRHALRMEERCTRRAEATVSEVIRRRPYTRDGASYSWHPLVEFDYEGRKIQMESSSGGGRKKYYEGQILNIFHDPDDPSVFYIEGHHGIRFIGTIFKWVGIAGLVVAVGSYMMISMVII